MTDPTASAVPHAFDTAYAEQHLGTATTRFTGRRTADGLGVVLEGRCPGCQGRTRTEYRRGVPGSGTKGLLSWLKGEQPGPGLAGDLAALADEWHYCECGHPHPLMPGDAVFVGCGASWRVAAVDPA
ncbi:hypothetical protein [Streptomyces sp. VRA16 Mangrove soil]|uniref:hypothetical protein n=1 Tax=Streptomyces sp. VRA16 Mangrove soil TaxID=2817434 RepID=UPI001A9D448C|nr:hypothetical protein [Streptomyces sp. VRA16 Mangrove soil]MBO1331698.1 hypothetical protein [Streptomyces sp. VRA16 Mangrove soil]